MTELQKAFSRHEKIRRMLTNLEDLKNNGEIEADAYAQAKTQYEALLQAASENLKEIAGQIKAQRQRAQETLNKLQADASSIATRGKVGELTPEQVATELRAIQVKKDTCSNSLQQYDAWLAARSSSDVGGYVEVDANETIIYRPEATLDWGKVAGNIGERAKGLVGEKIAGSVAGLGSQMYEATKGARGGPLKKKLPLIIGACAGILLVLFLGYKILGGRSSGSTLKEKTIMQVIQKKYDKEPVYYEVALIPTTVGVFSRESQDILHEMAQAGLIMATDAEMKSFGVAPGTDALICQKDNSFVLHVAKADNFKVVRFTPPADDGSGIKVSHVDYQYQWKPTEILSSPKFQGLRDKMRKELSKVEGNIKLLVSQKAVVGLYTDGWNLIEEK